jgi:hypothetical protein
MAKRPESAFPLWRRGIPRLGRALSALKRLEGMVPSDEVAAQLELIDAGLKVNREIRETLLAEMRVRREIVELRKLELDGMTEDDVEALLVRTARRRGFRHIDGIREGLLLFFQENGFMMRDQAMRVVDRALPRPDNIERKRNRLTRTLGQSYDALAGELEEGAREAREALEDSASSEGQDSAQPRGDTTGNDGGDSEDAEGPEALPEESRPAFDPEA